MYLGYMQIPFYIRDLSILGFWYHWGGGVGGIEEWASWNQSLKDTEGYLEKDCIQL